MRQILLAGEEPQKCSPFVRVMLAYCSAQHRISRLQRIHHRADRHWPFDIKHKLPIHPRQVAQVIRNLNSTLFAEFNLASRWVPQVSILRPGNTFLGYGIVCTSTDSTAGKSCTIAFQLSPPSGDTYTCPPVVPK